MTFDERLQKAIQRGQKASTVRAEAEAERALNEQELRRLHTQYRLELSEHIEACLKQLGNHLPGFRFETIVSDRGWGAAVNRDDLAIESSRRRSNYFSRLEILIRPVTQYFVLELAGKAAIRNKESFNRSQYQRLADVDLASFTGLIDQWVLEYAELYTAKG